MISRREVMLTGAFLAVSASAAAKDGDGFIHTDGKRLLLQGKPYRFVGTNMWYGAYLGRTQAGRDRIKRELDQLCAIGITNLRVLGASEQSPLKNALSEAIHERGQILRPELLAGLDFLIAEAGRRGIKCVIYMNNFWEWSGGFVTYLYWTNGGHYIDLGDPAHPWPEFADFSARFYASAPANALYREYVAALVGRINSVTGRAYRDDPTILSWQLANEPRPGGSPATTDIAAFTHWLDETARFIKKLDPNHLVSSGNEGLRGCLDDTDCLIKTAGITSIDYITFHIWPLNWGWIDIRNMAGSFTACTANTTAYLDTHIALAERLNKPLVAEEFGFPRDENAFSPQSQTSLRDRYYKQIFDRITLSARQDGPFVGTNFWAWGGEGRASHENFRMLPGDGSYVGDPPQEPQGQNSVFDTDATTLALIRTHAAELARCTA